MAPGRAGRQEPTKLVSAHVRRSSGHERCEFAALFDGHGSLVQIKFNQGYVYILWNWNCGRIPAYRCPPRPHAHGDVQLAIGTRLPFLPRLQFFDASFVHWSCDSSCPHLVVYIHTPLNLEQASSAAIFLSGTSPIFAQHLRLHCDGVHRVIISE